MLSVFTGIMFFAKEIEETISTNYMKYVLPEVLTRTNDPLLSDDERNLCFCNRPPFGKMVVCGGPSCKIKRFHLSCVPLKRMPSRLWFGNNCRGRPIILTIKTSEI